nr:hypothetical protein CFP56_62757 [Quercus suber]
MPQHNFFKVESARWMQDKVLAELCFFSSTRQPSIGGEYCRPRRQARCEDPKIPGSSIGTGSGGSGDWGHSDSRKVMTAEHRLGMAVYCECAMAVTTTTRLECSQHANTYHACPSTSILNGFVPLRIVTSIPLAEPNRRILPPTNAWKAHNLCRCACVLGAYGISNRIEDDSSDGCPESHQERTMYKDRCFLRVAPDAVAVRSEAVVT